MNNEPTSDELQKLLKAQPMRLLNTAFCKNCGYRWVAPKIGNCPQCKKDGAKVEDIRVSGLRTV